MREMARLAEQAARAGASALSGGREGVRGVRTKSSAVDLVTEADVASGIEVVRRIVQESPGARFVVEEDEVYDAAGVRRGSLADDEVWVVDPLDGTTSFVHGYPCYSVSIALLREGEAVAGAVYAVPTDEMFLAWSGGGAWRNGDPIAPSTVHERDRALLVTGFPYEREAVFTRQMRIFERLVRASHDVRRDGSAAIDCCHVAMGRCDGYWEIGLKPWDIAAGMLIAREAGGIATGMRGEPWTTATSDVLVATPALHGALLDEISAVDPGSA